MNLPSQIKQARKQVRMTQEQLASVLNIHRTTLANYEIGRVDVPLDLLEGLAKATRRSPAWFLLQDGERIETGPPEEVSPLVALRALDAFVTRTLAEPVADKGESQELAELRAEVQALREQLAAADLDPAPRRHRQIGQPKDRMPQRKRNRKGGQGQADTG